MGGGLQQDRATARQRARLDPVERHVRAGAGRDRGQSSVEVALLLPFLALLLLAVIQVGLVVRDQGLVVHAAREAARAAAVDTPASAARDAATSAADLSPARLSVEVSGRGEAGSRVEVVVRYRSPTSVPLVGRLVGDAALMARATMRVE